MTSTETSRFYGLEGSCLSGGLGWGLPPLLRKYLRRRRLRLVAVDVNVGDVTAAEIEILQLMHVIKYYRVRRNTGKLLFVRKVNRRSMRVHGRPAYSWLRYAKNLDSDWVNKSVGLVKKLAERADAVIIEDLDGRRLKLKLKSKDPEKALLFSSWPVAKIVRRITAIARKAGKLLIVPPHYSSRLCPRCNTMMKHENGRWDRLRCEKCGFADDRDHVAVRNLARTALILNGFHYLATLLGRQLREYREALRNALAQDPESQGPSLGGERGGTLPKYPPGRAWARGILGEGVNEPFLDGGWRSQLAPQPSTPCPLMGADDIGAVGSRTRRGRVLGAGKKGTAVGKDLAADNPLLYPIFYPLFITGFWISRNLNRQTLLRIC